MHKLLLTTFFAAFISFFAQAQQYQYANESLPCLNKEFTIVAHVIRDSLGIIYHSEADIQEAVTKMNTYFKPICASFKICEFQYHNNFQYIELTSSDDPKWQEMQIKYHEENRINVYFVKGLGSASGFADFEGITNMDSLGIVIQEPGAIIRYMGRFFGLYPTSEGGDELVDGSNCATAGDFICDTPADPGENDEVEDCIFTGTMKDVNGQYYTPDVGNVMSGYDGDCTCGFTAGQLRKMAEVYLGSDPKMW